MRDATPPPGEWTDFFLGEIAEREAVIDKLRNEVSRRDAVLDWLAVNSPASLELCPWKLGSGATDAKSAAQDGPSHGSSASVSTDAPHSAASGRSPDEMLCSRLTTETGSIIELWETGHGFELLFAEAHLPDEVVHAVELRLVEVESLAGSMATAVAAVEAESRV